MSYRHKVYRELQGNKQRGFNASCFQIRMGYLALRNAPLPSDLSFWEAGNGLVRDFGIDRVSAVLLAVPNDPAASEEDALAAARNAAFRFAVERQVAWLNRRPVEADNAAAFAEHCRAAFAAGRGVNDTAAAWSN